MRGLISHRLATKLGLVAVGARPGTASLIGNSVGAQPAAVPPVAGGTARAAATVLASPPQEGMYAYYYLWWDTQHWQTTLGANYPYGQKPLPLPATLDASGCNPSSLYSGNVETDEPATLFTQDDPSQIGYDVQSAIAAGLTGFAVDWYGTGRPPRAGLRRREPAPRPPGAGSRPGPGRGARPTVAVLRGVVDQPDPDGHRR